MRPLVIIESPFRADHVRKIEHNVAFGLRVCKLAISEGLAPFGSHLFFPGLLDDNDPDERRIGIECGWSIGVHADQVWFCLRLGEKMSEGMRISHSRYKELGIPCRYLGFSLGGNYIEDMTEQQALEGYTKHRATETGQ